MGPPSRPVGGKQCIDSMYLFLVELFVAPECRLPGCNRRVFYDRRVSELREWCSDQHMT
jgi:hypothetical protein